jgi:hypothetical protein
MNNEEKIITYMIVSSILLMVSGVIVNMNEIDLFGSMLILTGSAVFIITFFSDLLYGIWKSIREKRENI